MDLAQRIIANPNNQPWIRVVVSNPFEMLSPPYVV